MMKMLDKNFNAGKFYFYFFNFNWGFYFYSAGYFALGKLYRILPHRRWNVFAAPLSGPSYI